MAAINDDAIATPYPSIITVPSLSGTVTKVTVTITGLTHTYADDINSIVLVGPQGQNVVLMSAQGGSNGVSGVNLTFDDSAASELPDSSQITSGTYKPRTTQPTSDMPSPAPARPYGTTLSVFNGIDPQGTWRLYVRDVGAGDSGLISGGWSLTLTGVTASANLDQIHYRWRNDDEGEGGTPVGVDAVSTGDTRPATFTISHTTATGYNGPR